MRERGRGRKGEGEGGREGDRQRGREMWVCIRQWEKGQRGFMCMSLKMPRECRQPRGSGKSKKEPLLEP